MKPVQRVYLSTQQVHCPDIDLVLELNSCGRGFLTAQTDQDYTGKLVRVDVGYTHPGTGLPTNAGEIEGVAEKTDTLNEKYSPIIAK